MAKSWPTFGGGTISPANDWHSGAALSIVIVQPSAGTVRVQIAGEIDLASVQQLETALLAVLADAAPGTQIWVDLVEVAFLDAVGVGALLRVRDAARRARVRFSLQNPHGTVRLVLDVLNLTEVLCADPPAEVPDVTGPVGTQPTPEP